MEMNFRREMECSKVLYKRFTKMNYKREKKGQPPLTQEEFAKIIRKEERIYSKKTAILMEAIGALLVVVAVIGKGVIAYGMDLFNLIFGTVMFLILFGCFHLSFQSEQMITAAKLEILKRCEEQGIDIVTYWEAL